jgi:hypothetical protein
VTGNNGITGAGTSGAVVLGLQTVLCSSGSAIVGLGPVSCSPFATLAANTFTGNQTLNGNLIATGTSGNTISATTAVKTANAVFASNTATSGNTNGGYFQTYSPAGTAVVGINYGSGGAARYFEGNVTVTGNLSKGGGSFKIDHPLDPANKYLYHSFVESPDMMNVYNGNVTTNQRGVAVITLPDYFEALNRDFRYQLTVIGQFAQAIVAKEISRNRFTIKTSKLESKFPGK